MGIVIGLIGFFIGNQIYYGFLREMAKDFGRKSKEEIIEMGRIYEDEPPVSQ